MITHYIKIAFRNMWKYRTQSLIGIFGLAFGLACFVPALYWLRYETTYDSFYPDAENIYRVYLFEKNSGKVNERVSGLLERKMHEQFAATENSTIFFIQQNDCQIEGMPHIRLHTIFTDSAFLRVFPQEFVSGDALQPLEILHNIVITESVAIRLFGDVEKAIGQQIKSIGLERYAPYYTVTAVVKDPPSNTDLSFDAIFYFKEIEIHKTMSIERVEQIWNYGTMQMYMKLHPDTDVGGLAEQLRDFPAQLDANANKELRMMPVSDTRYSLHPEVPFTLNFVRLFVAAGILLLFSAIFNFLNLHLNIFRQRIHELHQRAVHGAKSKQLVMQMLFELSCAILLALALACFFVIIICPAFSGLLGIEIGVSKLIYLFIICGTGVMALMWFIGIFPFWQLSLIAMQRLSKRKTHGQPVFRRMAVSLQLAVSVVFIIATLVVMLQLRFVSRKDLGFDSTGVINLSGLSFVPIHKAPALMHEFSTIPQIENFTFAYFEPQHNAKTSSLSNNVEWQGKLPSENSVFHTIATDSRFDETFGLTMLMGEWFDEVGKDKVVLNEEAVRIMGLDEPIGSIINMSSEEYTVVGVVKDFHTLSLRSRILPTILFASKSPIDILYFRVVPGQEQEAIQRINSILSEINVSLADVNMSGLTELYDRLNRSEQVGLQLFSVLATICLLISLFGIYAVAVASTQRRRKEIAIRKVFGAEVRDIVRIFFREYTLQVIIAGAIALPLAYYAMHQWLQGYAYRTNIPLWLLVGVIIVLAAVVLLTVLGQIWKAANQNPAEVVKN